MNSGVDFAAGGIVILEQKILIVKNKRGDSPENGLSWWGYPKVTWKKEKSLQMQL